MENLVFSLNAILPIFLMMVLGYFFAEIGIINKTFAASLNQFVFKIALPVLVFKDLATSNFKEVWDIKLVVYCFVVTLVSIFIMLFISNHLKDKTVKAEFIQASFRSSSALLGGAIITNMYGDAKMATLMIIGSVPLYNVAAVVLLTLFKPPLENETAPTIPKKQLIKDLCKGIVTNPIIIGIFIGILWSLSGIKQPTIMQNLVNHFASMAAPLGLMAMGASLDIKKVSGTGKLTLVCTFFKLVGFVALFLPFAILLGFREAKLVSILIMLGAATTVSCFTMASSMGHEGVLTSNVVVLTTLLSSVTLTIWIYLLKVIELI